MARKKKEISSVKGMHDILPEESPYWEKVRSAVTSVASYYGFGRIATPTLESAELFERTSGSASDVVTKEMYTFRTRGGDMVSMRPEGTAPVARAYIEHGMASLPQPVKLFYLEPMFRYESPQKGRTREHHQFGFEILGLDDPLADAEAVQIAFALLTDLGVKRLLCEVNTLGDKEDREKYKKELKAFLRPHLKRLPADDKRRYKENVLRVLDSKEPETREIIATAPQIIDFIGDEARDHFKKFLEFLDELELPYLLNPYLVRGLDYYNRTVFEIRTEDIPVPKAKEPDAPPGEEGEKGDESVKSETVATATLVAGGRYDDLVTQLGGKHTPAVGFGAGVERIIEEMKSGKARIGAVRGPRLFLVQLGELAKKKGLKLMEMLRKANLPVSESLGKHSIRSQMKIADKLGVDFALILGQKEALSEEIIVRDMVTGVQETIPVKNLVADLKRRLERKRAEKI